MTTARVEDSADARARAAMLAHHAALCQGVEERVTALSDATRSGTSQEPALSKLRDYLTGEVLPHAAAEEAVLYPAVDGADRALIDTMLLEHGVLATYVRRLDSAIDGLDTIGLAAATAAVFTLHVRKENDILIPALLRTPGVALSALLTTMERQLSAHAGADTELDVRALSGPARHEAIRSRLERLTPGERLTFVNDHDPKPLLFQIDATAPGTFDWHYLQRGPHEWRVTITRPR